MGDKNKPSLLAARCVKKGKITNSPLRRALSRANNYPKPLGQ
jgi:hypothetical protein